MSLVGSGFDNQYQIAHGDNPLQVFGMLEHAMAYRPAGWKLHYPNATISETPQATDNPVFEG